MASVQYAHRMDAGLRTPSPYRQLDAISGGLLLFMTVWAPWAFGCTVSWAIWTLCTSALAGVFS